MKKGTKKDSEKKSDAKKINKPKINLGEKIKSLFSKFNELKNNIYIGYIPRLIIFLCAFIILFFLSYLCVKNSYTRTEEKITTYREFGNVDYKVYLKPNEFYSQSYLGKNMVYITSIIKNIKIDYNYQFLIDEQSDINFNYSISARLVIADESGQKTYYEKEYSILPTTVEQVKNKTGYSIYKSITIDYDYYNTIASKFKSQYGLSASSNLIVSFKLNKGITSNGLNEASSTSVTIPLTERAINIKTDTTSMNNTKELKTPSKTNLSRKFLVVVGAILFIGMVASLLRFLELLLGGFKRKSPYDKKIDDIFKEYDRLIVETKTMPNFEDKNIIRIEKFEELLDARDTLKSPILYFNIASHHKCYFYIKSGNDVFLTIIKAVDLEEKKDEKKKAKK